MAPRRILSASICIVLVLIKSSANSDEAYVPRDAAAALGAARASSLAGMSAERDATALIREARLTADPRGYGRAEALIERALSESPSNRLLVLRATVRQAMHDFSGALADLDRVLAASPTDPQALISRAFIQMTRGQYPAALGDCRSLPRIAGAIARSACFAWLSSLTGNAAGGYALLSGTLAAAPHADAMLRSWAHGILAQIAARIEDPAADAHFQQALTLSGDAPQLRVRYADHLVARGDAARALTVLGPELASDDALLVRALAKQMLALDHSDELAVLRESFGAARSRGDMQHLREEARFLLSLADRPADALEIAEENWAQQKEPEDLRLLVEAADAAGQPERAAPALSHCKTFGLEDAWFQRRLAGEAQR